MNQYTEDQIIELFDIVRYNGIYPSYVASAFMSDETNLATNTIILCRDSASLYKNMQYTQKDGNYFDGVNMTHKRALTMEKIRNFIFLVEKEDIPLYINEDLLRPIFKWRLAWGI
jgi:isocitrate lyase